MTFAILGIQVFAQKFPKFALILERRIVNDSREMVLWMNNPKRVPRNADEDEIYTCPEETRGSYYSGIANVSLIDLKTLKTINTIELQGNGISSDDNTLDLPFWIHRGYYDVPVIDQKNEGKPVLIDLKDYNADGKAYEFALFDAVACMGLPSTLIGYSEKQDKVIQYQTELKTEEGTSKRFWIDYLFGQKPDESGFWKYQIDYRGRGGALETFEIRYDAKRELFFGTRTSLYEDEEIDQ